MSKKLLADEYTRESWLPGGEDNGESRLPSGEYMGRLVSLWWIHQGFSTSWSLCYQNQNWFTKKITGAYSRESQLHCVFITEKSLLSVVFITSKCFCKPFCRLPGFTGEYLLPGDGYSGELRLQSGKPPLVLNAPGSRLRIRILSRQV